MYRKNRVKGGVAKKGQRYSNRNEIYRRGCRLFFCLSLGYQEHDYDVFGTMISRLAVGGPTDHNPYVRLLVAAEAG